MRTRFIFVLIFLFTLSFITKAQPRKGSFEIGGFGYFSKGKSELGDKITTYEFNTNVSYFIFNHLSVGVKMNYDGYNNPDISSWSLYNLTFGPTLEAYFLNKNRLGISVKSGVNLVLKNNMYPQEKNYASFIIGPKVAWNITTNLSTSLWFAYRNTKNFDEYSQAGSSIPSDNFDLRWGFSYYLHRKKTKNN